MFSIILAASATLMLSALWVPAVIIPLYKSSTKFDIFSVEPDVTLTILTNLWFLSPGFILSGLYPQKKSLLNLRPEHLSRIGTQNSSVAPG